jgi:site-specific DNA recombinase
MSAARRKGKWTGGMLILGYDVEPKTKRLIVNEAEAARVREIFELYLRERALIPTVKELARRGWTTKRWQTVRETERGGKLFDKTALFYLLTNITYIGKTEYKGEIYEGEHPAIVSEDVWQRVQNLLRENRRTGGRDVRNKYGALLKGMLYCEACNAAMIHSYTNKGVKRYRYYVCSHAQKNGWDTCPTKSLPAAEMERIVIQSIRSIGEDDQLAGDVIAQVRKQNGDRLRLLENERDGLVQDLAKFNEELRRLVTPAKGQGQVDTARMANLNERIREAEQRVTNLREEILELQGAMIDEGELRSALSIFDPVWDSLTPKERVRVMQLLIERIGYDPETSKISLTFRPTGIRSLQIDLMAGAKQN